MTKPIDYNIGLADIIASCRYQAKKWNDLADQLGGTGPEIKRGNPSFRQAYKGQWDEIVFKELNSRGGVALTSEIILAMASNGVTGIGAKNRVRIHLAQLVNRGKLVRLAPGQFCLPGDPATEESRKASAILTMDTEAGYWQPRVR